jgi:2-oxoglutarate dehydrogenase complex dehydrogenase (E1) component-like enzyme
LVEEMHEQYLSDPESVSESWREFFAGRSSHAASGRRTHAEPGGHGTAAGSRSRPQRSSSGTGSGEHDVGRRGRG